MPHIDIRKRPPPQGDNRSYKQHASGWTAASRTTFRIGRSRRGGGGVLPGRMPLPITSIPETHPCLLGHEEGEGGCAETTAPAPAPHSPTRCLLLAASAAERSGAGRAQKAGQRARRGAAQHSGGSCSFVRSGRGTTNQTFDGADRIRGKPTPSCPLNARAGHLQLNGIYRVIQR